MLRRRWTLALAVSCSASGCAPSLYVPPTPPSPSLAACESAQEESSNTISQPIGATPPKLDLVFQTEDGLQTCVPGCDEPCVHEVSSIPIGQTVAASFAARDIAETGTPILRALSFTNESDSAFVLLGPTPEEIGRAQDQCITVSFSPDRAGETSATLRLETDGENAYGCDRTVEVRLVGVGDLGDHLKTGHT